jgi:hypothetical protein
MIGVTGAASTGAVIGGVTGAAISGNVQGAVTGAAGGALVGYGMGMYGPATAVNPGVAANVGHVNIPGSVVGGAGSAASAGLSFSDYATMASMALNASGGGQQAPIVTPSSVMPAPPVNSPMNTQVNPVLPDLSSQALATLGKKRGRASTILAGSNGDTLGGMIGYNQLMGL